MIIITIGIFIDEKVFWWVGMILLFLCLFFVIVNLNNDKFRILFENTIGYHPDDDLPKGEERYE